MLSLIASRPSIAHDLKRERSECVVCGAAGGVQGDRGVCLSCMSKVADYNAMTELVDDALVGSERVAVCLPLRPHAAVSINASPFWEGLRAVWSGYPVFAGDLGDVDHLDPSDVLPSDALAVEYAATLPDRKSEYRLVPRHQARALALLDFLAVRLLLSGSSSRNSSGTITGDEPW